MVKTLLLIAVVVAGVGMAASIVHFIRVSGKVGATGKPVSKTSSIVTAVAMIAVAAAATIGLHRINSNNDMIAEQNPFFEEWTTPFGVPPFDKIAVEHYVPAFERAMELQNAAIDSIVRSDKPLSFEGVVEALDRSGADLNRVANVFFLLCSAETSEEMQEIEAEISPRLSAHCDRIILNDSLFERIKAVYEHRDELCDNAAKRRLTEQYYKRFVRNGALLSAEDKAELQRVNEELSLLEVKFVSNVLAATNEYELVLTSRDLTGLPSNIVSAAQAKAEELGHKNRYVFTLHAPSWIPFLTYSSREDLRKQLYTAYLNRCAADTEYDNTAIVNDMIRLRLRKAKLLGFDSYASFVLDNVMAKTPENVYNLLDDLWEPALNKAKEELEVLRAEKLKDHKAKIEQERAKKKEPNPEEYFVDVDEEAETEEPKQDSIDTDDVVFNSWDWWYYAERVKRSKYSFDEESLRPYLSLSNVRQGVFELSNRLYGVTFRPVNVPVYHSECQTYEVLDRDNSHLGVIYMDFFPRAGKESGAWCGEYRSQCYSPEGERISPVVTIVANFTRPVGNGEALLTIDETLTFFHEFGHALHNLFKDVPYEGVNDVERDFVELPSQLLENWAFESKLLKQYAVHINTGEVVPDRLLRRYRQSQSFNKGFPIVELLAAAYIDLDLHNIKEYSTPIDLAAYEEYMLKTKRGLMPQIEPRYRFPYFKHIFGGGYASGYYSYLWSEVLDKDAYQAFVETGDIFNRKVADRFRFSLLSQGGMKDGMELYVDFRDTLPSREPLLKARDLWVEPVVDSLTADSLRKAAEDILPR